MSDSGASRPPGQRRRQDETPSGWNFLKRPRRLTAGSARRLTMRGLLSGRSFLNRAQERRIGPGRPSAADTKKSRSGDDAPDGSRWSLRQQQPWEAMRLPTVAAELAGQQRVSVSGKRAQYADR